MLNKNEQKTIDAWQIMRMQGEFIRIFDEFSDLKSCVSIFGSARTDRNDKWYKEAFKAGDLLVKSGFTVITGGGPGIMEAANRGAALNKQSKPHSIGVGIELPFEASMNDGVEKGLTCRYFFTRKVSFLKYSQGFIVFPGGLGTLDELFETLTLAQTGHAPKFPIILVGVEYWSGLYEWLKETVCKDGKMSEKDFDLFRIVDSAEEAIEKICDFNQKYRKDETINF